MPGNTAIWEAKAGRCQVQVLSGLQSETLPPKKRKLQNGLGDAE